MLHDASDEGDNDDEDDDEEENGSVLVGAGAEPQFICLKETFCIYFSVSSD